MSIRNQFNKEDLEQLHSVFVEEADELLEQLAKEILFLSGNPDDRGEDSVRNAMRTAHNLKGAAMSVGAQEVADAVHWLEAQLERLTTKMSELTPELTAELKHQLETIRDLLEQLPWNTSADTHPSGPQRDIAHSSRRIRVEAERLDNLMSYTGDLLANHSRLARNYFLLRKFNRELLTMVLDEQGELSPVVYLAEEMGTILEDGRVAVQTLERTTSEMNDALKVVRMIPIRDHTAQWRRIVREAAGALGRPAELHVEVGDLELDKHILDSLKDSFVHLLRNAVGHGIETAEDRRKAGKPEVGQILVRADTKGGLVRMEISDDGAGLDLEKIAEVGTAQGLVSKEELRRMGPESIASLIFEDGFSTSDSVDNVSGRGVGLNIVRQAVERIGGAANVTRSPRLGGTTLEIILPPSMLSTSGLLVSAGDSTYAVPVSAVVQAYEIGEGMVEQTGVGEVFSPPGESPVQLYSLSRLAGSSDSSSKARGRVLIIEHGERRLGMVVDEILAQQEIVTKPLPWNIEHASGVNGGVVLDDGSLAFTLDVPALVSFRHRSSSANAGDRSAPESECPARILVIDDAMTARTLQKNMLAASGYDVVTCASGQDGLDVLKKDHFDLIVSDVQMPGMDGLELTRLLRVNPDYKTIPIILVTSLASPEDVAKGLAAGADEYIVKGQFDQQQLAAAVSRQL